jgi:hypothetical protein
MNKELKEAVAKYVEKVGVDRAVHNAGNKLNSLVRSIRKYEDDKEERIVACKFKFAIIEYLYFHDDTEEKAIELIKKVLNEI